MSVFWSKVVLGTRTQNIFRSEMYECFYSENSYMSRLRQDCRTDFKWAHLSGSYSTFTLLLRLGLHLIRLITRPQSQSLLMLSGFSKWFSMKYTQPPRPSHHFLCRSPLAIQVMIWFDILSIYRASQDDMILSIQYTQPSSPPSHPRCWFSIATQVMIWFDILIYTIHNSFM